MKSVRDRLPHSKGKTISHRQQRVAEEIRQILAQLLTRGDLPTPELQTVMVTLTHVDVSPDLRNAKVFIIPLGNQHNGLEVAKLLNKHQATIRYEMAKELHLKFMPTFRFFFDESFDRAEKMDALITSVVAADQEE